MAIDKNLFFIVLLKEGWKQFKIISIVFLGITLTTAILLITTLPKTAVFLGSCIATIIITPLVINWKEYRNKIYKDISSPNMYYQINISDSTWKDLQKKETARYHIQANSNFQKIDVHMVA